MAKAKPQIDRKTALEAKPVKAPPARMERKTGKLYVTVKFQRPGWQRFLGSERTCERSFGLDAYGQEIYARCDGKTSVKKIVEGFAGKHRLSVAEAELAVTAFLKTLMSKGLVGMQVED